MYPSAVKPIKLKVSFFLLLFLLLKLFFHLEYSFLI